MCNVISGLGLLATFLLNLPGTLVQIPPHPFMVGRAGGQARGNGEVGKVGVGFRVAVFSASGVACISHIDPGLRPVCLSPFACVCVCSQARWRVLNQGF